MYVDEIRVQLAENRPQKQVQERLREYICLFHDPILNFRIRVKIRRISCEHNLNLIFSRFQKRANLEAMGIPEAYSGKLSVTEAFRHLFSMELHHHIRFWTMIVEKATVYRLVGLFFHQFHTV